MELLNIFASIGLVIDDLLAILSVVGSVILFIGAFSKTPLRKYGRIADWSILGLVLGVSFQTCMLITGTTPELVGMVFRMSPLMVDGLFVLSFFLLLGRWWIRKNLNLPKESKRNFRRQTNR